MSEAVQRGPNLTLAKLLPAQLFNKINKGKIGDITLKLAEMYTEACING